MRSRRSVAVAFALFLAALSMGQTVDFKGESLDVREALRSIFNQAKVRFGIAPEVQGVVTSD